MDVHIPKPWHGARELVKEIGTIVVGVLIAISAEQIVEAVHWRDRVETGRQSLRPDYADIVWNVGEQQGEAGCLRARLGAIRQMLIARPTTTPGLGQVGSPASRGWYPSSWDSLVAANIPAHMSSEVLVRMADIAVRARYLEQTQDLELSDWARIYAVLGPERPLSPDEFAQTLAAIADAQFRLNELSAIAPELRDEVLATGLLSAADRDRVRGEVARTLRGPVARRICGPPRAAEPGVVDAPLGAGG